VEEGMKKGFCSMMLGAMLVAASFADKVLADNKDKKEKIQILVVEKKEKNKSGSSGESTRPRSDGRKTQS
jgi:hypothetical protein